MVAMLLNEEGDDGKAGVGGFITELHSSRHLSVLAEIKDLPFGFVRDKLCLTPCFLLKEQSIIYRLNLPRISTQSLISSIS